jgi:hypothetical protein
VASIQYYYIDKIKKNNLIFIAEEMCDDVFGGGDLGNGVGLGSEVLYSLSLSGVSTIYKRIVEDRMTCNYFTRESGSAKVRNASIMLRKWIG